MLKGLVVLIVVGLMLVGCGENVTVNGKESVNTVKQLTTQEIVKNFQIDTNTISKRFGYHILNDLKGLSKPLNEDLRTLINDYKSKYEENPNLTSKEQNVSSGLLAAIFIYDKQVERKDDTFNKENALDNYSKILSALKSLKELGFEIS